MGFRVGIALSHRAGAGLSVRIAVCLGSVVWAGLGWCMGVEEYFGCTLIALRVGGYLLPVYSIMKKKTV
jgi:hypothetical protein